jgi:hypothetical protein
MLSRLSQLSMKIQLFMLIFKFFIQRLVYLRSNSLKYHEDNGGAAVPVTRASEA